MNKHVTAKAGKSSLNNRIAAALRGEASSATLAELLEEATAALAAATTDVGLVAKRALDPTLRDEDARALRDDAADLSFEISRLDTAVKSLRAEIEHAREREDQTRRRRIYENAKKAQDDLAPEFEQQYAALAEQLRELLARADECNTLVSEANRQLPERTRPLEGIGVGGVRLPGFWGDAPPPPGPRYLGGGDPSTSVPLSMRG